MKSIFGNLWFTIGFGLLLLAAILLNPATAQVTSIVAKKAVSVRKPIDQFEKSVLTEFRFLNSLPHATDVIADTDEFIEWRLAPKDPATAQCDDIYLQVYYYTQDGKPPILPHTPEVCYRQTGDVVQALTSDQMTIDLRNGESRAVPFKVVDLLQQQAGKNLHCCILYTFCVNGELISDREWARLKLAMPWNREIYFAKIEVFVQVAPASGFDKALAAGRQVMQQALPELLDQHLPE